MSKTAAQLTREEKNDYRRSARLRDEAEIREILARRERALSVAREAANILKENFGVTRVFVFGSLVTQSWFHSRSDIDLAVEGLKSADFWWADCRLEGVAEGFEIDLVDLDTAPPGLKQTILKDGKEI